MKNFKEKKGFYNTMQSKPALVFLGIVVVVFAISVISFVGKMQETIKNRKIVEAKISDLENAKDKLSADIASLQTEKGKEENIREKFGFAKEGEGIIVIVDDKESQKDDNNENGTGFFSWLKNLFK